MDGDLATLLPSHLLLVLVLRDVHVCSVQLLKDMALRPVLTHLLVVVVREVGVEFRLLLLLLLLLFLRGF